MDFLPYTIYHIYLYIYEVYILGGIHLNIYVYIYIYINILNGAEHHSYLNRTANESQ